MLIFSLKFSTPHPDTKAILGLCLADPGKLSLNLEVKRVEFHMLMLGCPIFMHPTMFPTKDTVSRSIWKTDPKSALCLWRQMRLWTVVAIFHLVELRWPSELRKCHLSGWRINASDHRHSNLNECRFPAAMPMRLWLGVYAEEMQHPSAKCHRNRLIMACPVLAITAQSVQSIQKSSR